MHMINEHDLLAAVGYKLEVWKIGTSINVMYKDSEMKDGIMLRGVFGRGSSFRDAINDYYRQIKGKTLVFNAMSDNRYEVCVI